MTQVHYIRDWGKILQRSVALATEIRARAGVISDHNTNCESIRASRGVTILITRLATQYKFICDSSWIVIRHASSRQSTVIPPWRSTPVASPNSRPRPRSGAPSHVIKAKADCLSPYRALRQKCMEVVQIDNTRSLPATFQQELPGAILGVC